MTDNAPAWVKEMEIGSIGYSDSHDGNVPKWALDKTISALRCAMEALEDIRLRSTKYLTDDPNFGITAVISQQVLEKIIKGEFP